MGLMDCEVAKDLKTLKILTKHAKVMVTSGSDEVELRDVLINRNLINYFEGGVFGSPNSKEQIFAREIENKNIIKPAVFIGDSNYDYQVAKKIDIDFIFISQLTDVNNYRVWCFFNNIKIFKNLSVMTSKI
jgi:phosphoglycolate phosphatase-like HAD superfamily hydrolase